MSITGSVVIVAGASPGAGRGIAESLGDAGAIVYATGRSVEAAGLPARVIRVGSDHTTTTSSSGCSGRSMTSTSVSTFW